MNRSTDLYVDGKRHILVADDEMINRELLENILSDEYNVIQAEDGQMAYDQIRENRNTFSLILLDLMMPKLNGLDLLSKLKEDPDLRGIPVIVLTSDQASEVESLSRGAADFIPKPYPQPDVIRARISRSIELAEDRQIISATERDELTGLYSSEYFYRYGEQFDKFHPNSDMDALCLDVNHFHIVNERFGMAHLTVLSAERQPILFWSTVHTVMTTPRLRIRYLKSAVICRRQLNSGSAFMLYVIRSLISEQGSTVRRSQQISSEITIRYLSAPSMRR